MRILCKAGTTAAHTKSHPPFGKLQSLNEARKTITRTEPIQTRTEHVQAVSESVQSTTKHYNQ